MGITLSTSLLNINVSHWNEVGGLGLDVPTQCQV